MIAPPERSPERDAAIGWLLPIVPERGWTLSALRAALRENGGEAADAELLFPGGPADMVEAYVDFADRRMAEAAAGEDIASLRVSERVRRVIALRLEQARDEKAAVRRALAVLASPRHAALAATTLARTVDEIWFAAGDRSADFSWYTKRATLAGVYGATLVFWLRDRSFEDEDTLAFVDRRLAGVARFGRLKARVESMLPKRAAGTAS